MSKILKILESLDQFGVTFQPSIKYSKAQYQTWLGGVMSILLYGLSVCYLLYLFILWEQGQMLPTVTTAHRMQKNQMFTMNETFIQFEARKFQYTFIDPFNPQSLILQPVIYYFQNGAPIKPPSPVNFPIIFNSDGFHIVNISNFSIAISEQKTESSPEIEMMLGLVQCQEEFLFSGWKCADNLTIDMYFSQFTNTITMRQFIKEFDAASGNLDIIGRESMIPIQRTSVFQVQTYVRLSESDVDSGVLFTQMDSYQYIVDYRSANANLGLNYFVDIMQYNFYTCLYYKLDNIQQQQDITYPKISEVLAQGGSIASTLFLLSYVVVILNQKQLQIEAIHNVISMYYPDFKNIKISKDFLGKIKKVERNGKLLDLKLFSDQYKRLSRIGEAKLSISNQIYEISRLQFVLQSIFPSKQIALYHNQGIPLQTPYQDIESEQQSMKLDISVHPEKQGDPQSMNEKNNNENNLLKVTRPQLEKTLTNAQSDKILALTSQDDSVQSLHNHVVLKDSDFDLLVIQDEETNICNQEPNEAPQNHEQESS